MTENDEIPEDPVQVVFLLNVPAFQRPNRWFIYPTEWHRIFAQAHEVAMVSSTGEAKNQSLRIWPEDATD